MSLAKRGATAGDDTGSWKMDGKMDEAGKLRYHLVI
jgi:hypothetical protein